VAAGVGAGFMYVFDPCEGRRRRALARDQLVRARRRAEDALDATRRDLANRMRGVVAATRRIAERGGPADDVVVAERIRAELGRWTSHAGPIDVTVSNGRATLRGPVLADEAARVLRAVAAVPGVRGVDNRLDVHGQGDDVPGLQGGRRRPGPLGGSWSPTVRAVAGAAGVALVARAAARRTLGSGVLGALGLGVAARALGNFDAARLLAAGGRGRTIDVEEAIEIDAPVDAVFAFWRSWDNFPRFMHNVRAVRDVGGGRSHWEVAGPAGVAVEWDAEVTQLVPNEVVAWKTVPGSTVEHAGVVRFQPAGDRRTTLSVRLSYEPPAGALGHAVAALFGADPAREIAADLRRMKALVESTAKPDAGAPEGYVH
jgi:uncharacterized membrane protein